VSAVADRVGTGASLGEYDRLWTYLHRDKHTTCRVEGLNNPGLHQTLRKFDYSINDPLLPLLYFAGVEAFEAPDNLVELGTSPDFDTAVLVDDEPARPRLAQANVMLATTSAADPGEASETSTVRDASDRAATAAQAVLASGSYASSIRLILNAMRDSGHPVPRVQVNIALPALTASMKAVEAAAAAGRSPALTAPAAEALRAVARRAVLNEDALREVARASQAALEPVRAAVALCFGLNAGAGNVTFDFIRRLTHTAEGADEVAAQTSSAEQTGRRRGSQQVLSVIAECAAVLDLPEPDVAQAAGIARSSYFNWKSKPQTRPQLAKVSKLWLLAQAVTNLEDVTEGRAAHWLHADPSRRERVLAGDFEAVFDEAWREHLDDDMSTAGAQARAERQRTAAPAYAAGFAVGSDTAAEGASSGTTVRRGTVRSARRRPRSAEPDPRTSP
jgi:hypothetical protein